MVNVAPDAPSWSTDTYFVSARSWENNNFFFVGAAPGAPLQKKDTSVTFWAERIFFYHTYDTSMTVIVTKPGIIIDAVGSYFYDKKS